MNDKPAYPYPAQVADHRKDFPPSFGLTRRELFAAMAMQGGTAWSGDFESAQSMAVWAVESADALIAELEKDQ